MFTKMAAVDQQAGKKHKKTKRKKKASQTLKNGTAHTEDSTGEKLKGQKTDKGKLNDTKQTAFLEVQEMSKGGEDGTQTQKKKGRRRRSKRRQTDGSMNDPAAPQSQQVEGKTSTPAGGSQEGGTVTEAKKKKRKRKKKKAPENTNSTPPQSQSSAITPSKEPEQQNKRKRNKRKINHVGDSSTGVGSKEGKEEADEEDVPAKKLKKESPEGVPDLLMDGAVDIGEGALQKKNKKKKKKKKKGKQNPVGNALSADSPNGSKDDVMKQDNATNKIKEAVPADSLYPQKDGKPDSTADNEPEQKSKKKRKRKRKMNQDDNNSANIDNNEDKREEEVPGKKLKKEIGGSALNSQEKETTHIAGDTPQPDTDLQGKPGLTASQKRKMRKKQRKALLKEQAAITLPSSSQQTPILHSSCRNQENKEKIMSCWTSDKKKGMVLEEGQIEVIKSPFPCCYISNLLENKEFLEGVRKELDTVELLSKNNDLYKFQQTGDLKDVTTPFISSLRHLLYKDIRQWLIDVTGIPLSDTVDMGSSRYSHTDVLLCHDDELEGRRIAYILYLVPPWQLEDGGSLDLFSTDEGGHPKDIVRSLIPQHNAFAFFQVSPISFHQVSEVLSRDKTRLSINGWFHGPPLPWPKRKQPPQPPLQGPDQFEEDDFYAWINPMYLDMATQKEIRQKFCSESELELENFLTEEAHEKLSKAFRGESLGWEGTGPADRQSYEILDPDNLPQEVKECQQFLKCEAFFLVLSQLTGLKLHSLAPQDSDNEESDEESSAEPNPRCRVESQRWGHRCYTLIRDDCVDQHSALDVYLFTNVSEKWTQELGGHITYISKNEDEELLTVMPRSNCLSLVYRDALTLRFTKYINSASLDLGPEDSHYHSFAGVYYE